MQTTFIIEMRVNTPDDSKIEDLEEATRLAGEHLLASAAMLLQGGIRPEVIMRSDNWFSASKDIPLMKTNLEVGLAQIKPTAAVDDGRLSNELLAALKGE